MLFTCCQLLLIFIIFVGDISSGEICNFSDSTWRSFSRDWHVNDMWMGTTEKKPKGIMESFYYEERWSLQSPGNLQSDLCYSINWIKFNKLNKLVERASRQPCRALQMGRGCNRQVSFITSGVTRWRWTRVCCSKLYTTHNKRKFERKCRNTACHCEIHSHRKLKVQKTQVSLKGGWAFIEKGPEGLFQVWIQPMNQKIEQFRCSQEGGNYPASLGWFGDLLLSYARLQMFLVSVMSPHTSL